MEPDEAVAVLRELGRAFPRPDPRWHPYVEEIRTCLRDLEAAVGALERDPAAAAALDDFIERDVRPVPSESDAVRAAYARVDALPAPEGQHPFVAEILPSLDAMRVALAAVDASPAARRLFEQETRR